ncbi:hypothetical protein LTR85_003924 [Meristemomyces frigidus]|nr:hypothetical protein LTR85_003924 [Meristemomyces frigidus]
MAGLNWETTDRKSAIEHIDVIQSLKDYFSQFGEVVEYLPGTEREIILPQGILNEITNAIEKEGRDDPEVFDAAKDYPQLCSPHAARPDPKRHRPALKAATQRWVTQRPGPRSAGSRDSGGATKKKAPARRPRKVVESPVSSPEPSEAASSPSPSHVSVELNNPSDDAEEGSPKKKKEKTPAKKGKKAEAVAEEVKEEAAAEEVKEEVAAEEVKEEAMGEAE